MRNWLTFDGKSSKDFGVYISGLNTYGGAERDQTKVSVVGRNGDLTIDNGRYNNAVISYPAFIYDNFSANVAAFRNYLLSKTSYKRLEDTYHPDEFRLAKFAGSFDPDVIATLNGGEFNLTFDCYPQRYLKKGEKEYEFTVAGSIRNDTDMSALPLVRAYGDGSLTINGINIVISGSDTYTDIDCDLQEAYKDTLTTSKNNTITLTNGEFFNLSPGDNSITFTGITKVIIKPRWWIL